MMLSSASPRSIHKTELQALSPKIERVARNRISDELDRFRKAQLSNRRKLLGSHVKELGLTPTEVGDHRKTLAFARESSCIDHRQWHISDDTKTADHHTMSVARN